MDLSTNPFFTCGIDKLCTICHLILKYADNTHSIFSTVEELESPMNLMQILQSFSNFYFYNAAQMVCTTCYDKTIEVYKFIQMCNKADENMQHYLKDVEALKTIKDGTDVDIKVEEISIAPTRIIIDGQEFAEETETERIKKFDELGMVISSTEMKIEERILKEGLEKGEIKTIHDQTVDIKVEEISILPTRILIDGREFIEETENEKICKIDTSNNEETDSSDFDYLRVQRLDEQMHDERMGLRSHDQRHNSQRVRISKDFKANQDRHQPLKDHETDGVCLEVFQNDKQLKTHMRRSHKKKFLCNNCGKVFTTKSDLNKHIHVHTGEKPFTCKLGFVRSGYLRSHMDRHNGVKPHKCEQCDRRFTHASNLSRHMMIHNGIKAHKCEQCDRRFTVASDLRRHMDIHNGVKAHKCEQCDRRFTTAAHLRRHMDVHKGVKAHKCEQCERRFNDASSLRRHMNWHNGVKAHKCEQCDRQFTQAANLRTHMLIHSGVKAHKCEQCDRRFTVASSLRRHMGIHEGVQANRPCADTV